jgi:RNA polymerase sigma-70 factor, ECF subfamily
MVNMLNNEMQVFENFALNSMDHLYSTAIRVAGTTEEAELLVQQTYAAAFSGFAQFDKNRNFSAWLNELLMLFYQNRSCDISCPL